jgi:isochorismate hydrolase
MPSQGTQVASTVEIKVKEGNEALVAKKYGEALSAYDNALKALPERHSMVADLHGSKAAVYLSDKKYDSFHSMLYVVSALIPWAYFGAISSERRFA